jgi:hypothetical protein
MLFTYVLEERRLRRHFGRIRRWQVQLSDSESWTWTVTELATVLALKFILIDFTHSPAFCAGAIYAVPAYVVLDYLEGLDKARALYGTSPGFRTSGGGWGGEQEAGQATQRRHRPTPTGAAPACARVWCSPPGDWVWG